MDYIPFIFVFVKAVNLPFRYEKQGVVLNFVLVEIDVMFSAAGHKPKYLIRTVNVRSLSTFFIYSKVFAQRINLELQFLRFILIQMVSLYSCVWHIVRIRKR